MRIGIDTRPLETGHRFRGIGTYADELITAISRIDDRNQYVFLTQQEPSAAAKKVGNQKAFQFKELLIRKVKDPTRYYWWQDQFFLPAAIKKSGTEVVHILDQLSCPFIKPAKTIVTIHDLIQLMPIGQSDWKTRIKFKAIRGVSKVIAISESVKDDLIKLLGFPHDQIEVIYNGYDHQVFKPASAQTDLAVFRKNLLKGKAEKYLLYVGSFAQHEPRKNLNFLIDVFEKVVKQQNLNLALVLIGKFGAESERLKDLCCKKEISSKVIFLDFIPNKDLAPYFQAADIFIFPSLYEGFGIPPLQALATGTPVISSNTSSLPEVVGEAGILLDPSRADDWAESIKELSQNQALRAETIAKGFVQSNKFSWEKCAREVIQLYEKVYREK